MKSVVLSGLSLLAIAALSACGDGSAPDKGAGDTAKAYTGTEPWYVLNALPPQDQPYGLDVYSAKCMSCHGDLGQGVDKHPALKKMTPADMQNTLLAYRAGTVKGEQAVVTAHTGLSDAEIAAVSLYAGE